MTTEDADDPMGDDKAAVLVQRHPHNKGEIPDYHEPVWLGDTVHRDRAGRPHPNGRTLFARVICNNPGCEFEVLVNAEVVAAALTTCEYDLKAIPDEYSFDQSSWMIQMTDQPVSHE
jgi:hypothetical protein